MNADIIKQISSFFKSRKLAIAIIVLIIVFSILGTHIPQKSQLKSEVFETWQKNHPAQAEIFDFLGFTHIYSSFLFISLAVLLFINIFFCTMSMFITSLKRFKIETQFKDNKFIVNPERNTVIKTGKNEKEARSAIDSVLLTYGYKISRFENQIIAEKNRIGLFGTPFFHICILFIILAAFFGSSGRMEGDMRLIEGQALSEDHDNYMFINEGPFFNEKHGKFDISLNKFYADYTDETGTQRGPAGSLVIIENGREMKTGIVYSNHQMAYNGYTFLGNVYGLAPLLLLVNPDGTIYSGSYITATDQDNSQRYVSYFQLGDTDLEAGIMVYMTAPLTSDITKTGDVEKTPLLFIKIFDRGKEIYDGEMRLNDTVNIGDKTLGFYGIKYWSNFYVVRDDSVSLIIIGSIFITLALCISVFIVPGRIWVEIVDNGGVKEIHIGGKADKYRSLYEIEFFNIINKINEKLSKNQDLSIKE